MKEFSDQKQTSKKENKELRSVPPEELTKSLLLISNDYDNKIQEIFKSFYASNAKIYLQSKVIVSKTANQLLQPLSEKLKGFLLKTQKHGVTRFLTKSTSKEIDLSWNQFPIKTKIYLRLNSNLRLDENQSFESLIGPKSLDKPIPEQDYKILLTKNVEKMSSLPLESRPKLVHLVKKFQDIYGFDLNNMRTLSAFLGIEDVTLSYFWLSERKKNLGTPNNNLKKIYTQKYARFYCNICQIYACNFHFINKEDFQEDNEDGADYSYYEFFKLPYRQIFMQNFKESIISWVTYYRCPSSIKQFCYRHLDKKLDIKQVENFKLKKYQRELINHCLKYNMMTPCFLYLLTQDPKTPCLVFYLYMIQNNYLAKKDDFFRTMKTLIEKENLILDNEKINKQQKYILNPKKLWKNKNWNKDQEFIEFLPCFHQNSCSEENCYCIKNRGYCEKYCCCNLFCEFLFGGCSCSAGECVEQSCRCLQNQRECDPDFCLKCCSKNNQYFKEIFDIQMPSCQNSMITYNIKTRLLLGKSKICDGLGIFAGTIFKKGDFIGEYVGEVLNIEEADKRGRLYTSIDVNFLFTLNNNNVIFVFFILKFDFRS